MYLHLTGTVYVFWSVKLNCVFKCVACLEAGAEFNDTYHPGVWMSKAAKYSCCDAVNKRSLGCIPITHQVPKERSQLLAFA